LRFAHFLEDFQNQIPCRGAVFEHDPAFQRWKRWCLDPPVAAVNHEQGVQERVRMSLKQVEKFFVARAGQQSLRRLWETITLPGVNGL
jgi:hypothetical protein